MENKEEINKQLKKLNKEKILAYKEVEKIRFLEMDLLKQLEVLKIEKG